MKLIQKDKGLCLQDDMGLSLMENLSFGVRTYDGVDCCAEGPWQIRAEGEVWYAECERGELKVWQDKEGYLISTRFLCPENLDNGKEFVMLSAKSGEPFARAFGFKKDNSGGNSFLTMQSEWQQSGFTDGRMFECAEQAQAELQNGSTWIGGFVTSLRYFGMLYLEGDGKIEACQLLEHHRVAEGEWLESDVFWFRIGSDVLADQEAYCDLGAELMGGARKKFDVPDGYCTWYYYLDNIYGSEVLNNLPYIKRETESGRLPLKYVQIDHGWFDYCGDWEPNEKFPLGMKAYADKIKESGFIPGIWFIPFAAHRDSRIFREHPEYFARKWDSDEIFFDGDGRAQWDYSQPGAREYLAKLVRKFTFEWGFRYLKMDIIAQTLSPERYADEKFNSLQNYREAFKVIAENVPEDTFIMGCTAPFLAAVGLVDSMRISPDVVLEWKWFNRPFSQTMNHFAMNGRFFISDPDCIEMHDRENEDSYCTLHAYLNTDEKRLFASTMAAAGGTFMTSDKFSLMTEEQLDMLGMLFPRDAKSARPLDLGKASHPSVLDAGERNGVRRMVFTNFTDEEKSFRWDCPHCHVFDYWNKEYLGVKDVYAFSLKPHSCKVLYFADAEYIGMIGCDDVILPSFKTEKTENGLLFRYEKPGESVWMSLPRGVTPTIDGGKAEKVADGIWRCMAEEGTHVRSEYRLTW